MTSNAPPTSVDEGCPPSTLSQPRALAEWLQYLESIHPAAIDLGLERIAAVWARLGASAESAPIITVGGTNGKGSACAFLAAILNAAGYRVGLYTSPHLLSFTERIQICGESIDEIRLCQIFAQIEVARGDISLTYFEFGTLAAMLAFDDANVDVVVLEVGLGGRLDAVNMFEPSCSVLVSVDLDHQAYLGNDRESIGYEKAGIFRSGVPAIMGDPAPPDSVTAYASQIGAPLQRIGVDFGFQRQENQWSFEGRHGKHLALPFPALRGAYQLANASVALAVLGELRERLPVGIGAIKQGLLAVEWPGRFQVLAGRPTVVLDVAHNPHAASSLRASLKSMAYHPTTFAVFSMLADKDIAGVVSELREEFDHWMVAGLAGPRGLTGDELAAQLTAGGCSGKVSVFADVAAAYQAACNKAAENDRIVVFGSFHTVAEVMLARQRRGR